MIDCTPEVMSFSIYLHKNFIQVPLPITGLHTPCPTLVDLARELNSKSVPLMTNGFIAYVHATFTRQVFYVPQ